jgi:cobyric acid synthase
MRWSVRKSASAPPRGIAPAINGKAIEIAVIHLPRIANFDDFDPLAAEPGVRVRYVDGPEQLGNPAAIILPGTKSTVNDLAWLRSRGFDKALQEYARKGGAVVGICGGYQMLGEVIHDPHHVESKLDSAPGLGLLPVETVFVGDKATHQASAQVRSGPGWFANLEGQTVTGYEIHMGRTLGQRPWLEITERGGQSVQVADGASSEMGRFGVVICMACLPMRICVGPGWRVWAGRENRRLRKPLCCFASPPDRYAGGKSGHGTPGEDRSSMMPRGDYLLSAFFFDWIILMHHL